MFLFRNFRSMCFLKEKRFNCWKKVQIWSVFSSKLIIFIHIDYFRSYFDHVHVDSIVFDAHVNVDHIFNAKWCMPNWFIQKHNQFCPFLPIFSPIIFAQWFNSISTATIFAWKNVQLPSPRARNNYLIRQLNFMIDKSWSGIAGLKSMVMCLFGCLRLPLT